MEDVPMDRFSLSQHWMFELLEQLALRLALKVLRRSPYWISISAAFLSERPGKYQVNIFGKAAMPFL